MLWSPSLIASASPTSTATVFATATAAASAIDDDDDGMMFEHGSWMMLVFWGVYYCCFETCDGYGTARSSGGIGMLMGIGMGCGESIERASLAA